MRILRELSRRKLRTSLTITGITIGIWALVVFSSLANQINGLVGMGRRVHDVRPVDERRDARVDALERAPLVGGLQMLPKNIPSIKLQMSIILKSTIPKHL